MRWDYIPVSTTGTELVPGRGFWWYWYDRDINPDDNVLGGGTSESVALDGFFLSAIGDAVAGNPSQQFDDNTNCASDQSSCSFPFTTPNGDPVLAGAPPGTVTPDDDDFYMIGNPFSFPMDFSAVSASGGTMAAQGFIWNPGNQSGTFPRTGEDVGLDGPGTYEVVFATPPPGEQGAVAVWNGVLVEVTKDVTGATPTTADDPGAPVTFTFDAAVAATTETPLFHGKDGDATATPEAYIQFGLFGETASGAKTRDETAYLRFVDGAQFQWDPMDASKPAWPFGTVGLIGVEGERDGESTFQAVKALPVQAAKRQTTLALKLSEPGTYELVWKSEGLRGRLYDSVTDEHIPLHEGRYVFTADATDGDWAQRFVLKTAPGGLRTAPKAGDRDEAFVGLPSPNPATDAFALDIATDSEAVVVVFDVLGRRVFETVLRDSKDGQTLRVPTESFTPGAYLVVVEADGVRETRRVTVVR